MRSNELCKSVSSHKVLTTNWLMQTLYQAGEGVGFCVTGIPKIFLEYYQLQIAAAGSEAVIGHILPGLEIGLGALSIVRGLCQMYNTWRYDEDTRWEIYNAYLAQLSYGYPNKDEIIPPPPKKELYLKGILELIKGGALVDYGYKALAHYQMGFSTYSHAISLSITGFMVATVIDTTVAIYDFMEKIDARCAKLKEDVELLPEFLNLILQAVKLVGVIFLFNANPAGWVYLAIASIIQLAALATKTCQGNIFSRMGFLPTLESAQRIRSTQDNLNGKDAVNKVNPILRGFTGRF